ncbi:hypothetical protein [Metallosphaera yellowstonensis]|uniref:hypothetical protein n=1 Tax=Metallosphaera yellowstonensis TaxID=1111107 RepID=UPI003CCB29C6
MTDNVVSELKSNRAQDRVGPGDPRGGSLPSGIPPGVYYADLTLGGRVIMVKLLAGTRLLRDTRQVPLHDRPLAQRGGGLSGGRSRSSTGTSRPWDPSFWRRERLQGYLTIFTVNNVVRELIGV